MSDAAQLAQTHWNETPLFLTEEERYSNYPWLYDAAEFCNHAGERVLEVGCGTGADLLQFAKHGAVATGVDITERHLELAHKRVADMAAIVRADMRQLPFADDSFDYVYSHGVLHHSDEPKKVAAEILRVLRPGGRFNIHVYALFSDTVLFNRIEIGAHWKQHVENSPTPVHLDLYTAWKLRKLFPHCKMSFSKYQSYHFPSAAPLFGWFLVGKGQKP